MNDLISYSTRQELVAALRVRYQNASKSEKSTILNEFVALTGSHRKHAIRVLRTNPAMDDQRAPGPGRKIYNEAVREALVVVWEAADRICGKRLKAILPQFVDSMERHGHLMLDSEVRQRLLAASPATLDRLLQPKREKSKSRRAKRSKSKASQQVKIKTFADWQEPLPGETEMDFVVHCGGMAAGEKIHSLVQTDVFSGWTEAVPLLAREQSLVVEGLLVLAQQFPIPIRAINSDNDSAFINDTLIHYCREQKIEFTRGRPYKSNDQAWIEQKNGAVIRKFVGQERFSGLVAGQTLAKLYQSARLYVNYFQPSFKLLSKHRDGSKLKRVFRPPQTPCDRLLAAPHVSEETKSWLQTTQAQLDPIELLYRIRECQSALASLSGVWTEGPASKGLEQFLAELPRLWEAGEVRPTHRQQTPGVRDYRTRLDPFDSVWPKVLGWLEQQPDVTAKSLFERLQAEYPGEFPGGQLRTLQRRVKQWRQLMAKSLVYACLDSSEDEQVPSSLPGASPQTPGILEA